MPGYGSPQPAQVVALTEARNASVDSDLESNDAVVLTVTKDSQYYLGKEIVARDELQKRIRELRGRSEPALRIYLRIDKSLSYKIVRDTLYEVLHSDYIGIGLVVADIEGRSETKLFPASIAPILSPPPPKAPERYANRDAAYSHPLLRFFGCHSQHGLMIDISNFPVIAC